MASFGVTADKKGNMEEDPPLSEDEEGPVTSQPGESSFATQADPVRKEVMELSELEIRIKDLMDGLTATARPTSTQYKKRTLSIVQSLVTYFNPLGYFKKEATGGQEGLEIPFEDIRELSYIGAGGQGAVFSGKYRDTEVAVKKVNDPKQTELKILRKFTHRNIIKFLGVCTKPPCYCIVMEYCRLGNLYSYLRRDDTDILPFHVIQWSRDICSGMHFLHGKKIIHRDLKSLNILVGDDQSMKISDFGISRSLDHQSTKMTIMGSAAWMPPELIRSEPCSEKVDIWSFGVCLWELLTREEPYKELNQSAVIYGVGSNTLSLPIPTGCPSDLKSLLQKCWQLKPKSRPSFSQILDELQVIALGEYLKFDANEYQQLQDGWRTEISIYLDKLTKNFQFQPMSQDEVNHIASMREEELRHAREVREMYEKKLAIASELCDILAAKKQELETLAKELEDKANQLKLEILEDTDFHKNSVCEASNEKEEASTTKQSPAAIITISKPRDSSPLAPDTLITEHGDYSPAVKDFLSNISNTQLSLSRGRHRRAYSYGGQSEPSAGISEGIPIIKPFLPPDGTGDIS